MWSLAKSYVIERPFCSNNVFYSLAVVQTLSSSLSCFFLCPYTFMQISLLLMVVEAIFSPSLGNFVE